MKGRKPYQCQESPHYWCTVNRISFITTAMSCYNLHNLFNTIYYYFWYFMYDLMIILLHAFTQAKL